MRIPKRSGVLAALIGLMVAALLATAQVRAASNQQAAIDLVAIDAYVTTQLKALGIPGMALAIVEGDQIVHLRGFGVADSSGRAVTPQTPFYIASVTKPITALTVMQLVEAGKVDLDAPLQQYLPWFELADAEASASITVRNVLNQTTGITRMYGVQEWTRQGLEELIAGLETVEINQPVGTTYQYSSLNYRLAGLLVEQASGQSYEDYVAQHIFEPLDMRHSYTSRQSALADGLSAGHHYMLGRAFPANRQGAFDLSSGGLIASVEDLSHFAIANLNDGRYGDASVLSAQGIAEMHTPPVLSNEGAERYAMGWDVGELDGTPFVGHSGLLYNFRSAIMLLPESQRAVVLLANATGFEQLLDLDQVTRGVASMLEGKMPAHVVTPWQLPFLYWSILLVPLVQILGIVFSWRHWRGKGLAHVVLTVVLYGGIAYIWLSIVPQLMDTQLFPGIRNSYPDIFYPLMAGVVLGIGWSVVYTVMFLSRHRTQ